MSSDALISLKVKACILLCALRGDFRYGTNIHGSVTSFMLTESRPKSEARTIRIDWDTNCPTLTVYRVDASGERHVDNDMSVIKVQQPFKSLLPELKQNIGICLSFAKPTGITVAVHRPEVNANIMQLRNGRTSVERGFAAWALAREGKPDGIEAIIEAFHSDRSRSVRIDSLNALVSALKSQNVEQSVVAPVVKAACNDGDEVICKVASRIMKSLFAEVPA